MRALVFSALALPLFCSHATAAPAGDVVTYVQAKSLETAQPDKACDLYKGLAAKKNFVLQDLAFLRQGLICVSPLTEGPDLSRKPWLEPLDLQRREQMALKAADPLAAAQSAIALARFEKSQKAQLAKLDAEAKSIAAIAGSDTESRAHAQELMQKAREDIAPRFIKQPTREQYLKIAQDFLAAREFAAARTWSAKVLRKKGASFDDKILARRIRRSSFKVEQKSDAYLKSLQDDWQWTQTQKYPGKAVEMGLVYAKALWTEGKTSAAKTVLGQIQKAYGRTQKLNEVLLVRGKMSEERKDWRAALAYYAKVSPLDLKSNVDKKIQFGKAWAHWKLREDEACINELESLIALGQDDPFESARAQFWKGRALKRAGRRSEAHDAFLRVRLQDPIGYYGALSYLETGEKMPGLPTSKIPGEYPASPLYDAAYFQALSDAGETDILRAAAEEALKNLEADASIEKGLPLFVAAAKADSYLPLFSQISNLDPVARADLLAKDPQLLFPMDFKDLILAQAQRFGLPPELTFSIIRQESAYNPFARSAADAFGLMQLLPSISKVYQKQVAIPVEHFEDLFRPEVNVPYGSALLKDLLARHENKVYLAAAAYNANEKALASWRKTRWTGDTIEFIEEIPYEETRAYVKLITRNFVFYARMLHPETPQAFPAATLGF